MKGKILDFSIQSNTGAISGEDGQRYNFKGEDWNIDSPPERGLSVDFNIEGTQAKEIYMAIENKVSDPTNLKSKKKSRITAGVFALVLGGFGVHKFYLGHKWPGVICILISLTGILTLFISNIVLGIICVIEGIFYLTKSDEEFEQTYIVEKKKWF